MVEACACAGLRTPALAVGGTDIANFVAELRSAGGADIIIGTPGRIDDMLTRHGDVLDMRELEVGNHSMGASLRPVLRPVLRSWRCTFLSGLFLQTCFLGRYEAF